jgi:hypothetical protein
VDAAAAVTVSAAQRNTRSQPCAVCVHRLTSALTHAATCLLPVGGRAVGPLEAAIWARLQSDSRAEVTAALAAAEQCDG